MAITKSYNKRMNTYYVYDTEYVWSEEKQKKVQKRHCIGKWDEATGKIIPTGTRGRHGSTHANLAGDSAPDTRDTTNTHLTTLLDYTVDEIHIITSTLSDLASKYHSLSKLIKSSSEKLEENHE